MLYITLPWLIYFITESLFLLNAFTHLPFNTLFFVCINYRNSLKSSSYCYKWLDFILFFKSESEVTQSCPTLCDPMDCSLQGSSVHRILQAGILEWVALPSSRGSSWPKDQTGVSHTAGRLFIIWTTRELPTNALFSMAITLNEWCYTMLYRYYIFFIHLSLRGHLDFFHIFDL